MPLLRHRHAGIGISANGVADGNQARFLIPRKVEGASAYLGDRQYGSENLEDCNLGF